MGAETGIEWADATVNVWEGCTKISPACKNCYAETNSPVRAMEMRIGEALQVEPSTDGKRRLKMWGVRGFRYETTNWERELRALNRKAHFARASHNNRVLTLPAGAPSPFGQYVRPRVFINSLSDIFEDWTGPVYRLEDGDPGVVDRSLDYVRMRFFRVAEECTELDILLLTKRPENVLRMAPGWWRMHTPEGVLTGWPSHIWIGATVEDQAHADKRIPELLKVPAKVRFLSVEPLLGKVELAFWLSRVDTSGLHDDPLAAFMMQESVDKGFGYARNGINWVIVGGESGTSARPMHPDWVRSIRDQCQVAGVPFFFKQWGEWAPTTEKTEHAMHNVFYDCTMAKVGKKNAGRVLDGELWSEVPGESF